MWTCSLPVVSGSSLWATGLPGREGPGCGAAPPRVPTCQQGLQHSKSVRARYICLQDAVLLIHWDPQMQGFRFVFVEERSLENVAAGFGILWEDSGTGQLAKDMTGRLKSLSSHWFIRREGSLLRGRTLGTSSLPNVPENSTASPPSLLLGDLRTRQAAADLAG